MGKKKTKTKNLTFMFALAGLFVSALMHSEFCWGLFGGVLRGGVPLKPFCSSQTLVPGLLTRSKN